MTVFKCKMCGASLNIENNEKIIECEYCGSKQTLPRLDDERRANLYDRANHFRRNNEFDKAVSIYEQILNEDKNDSEAYWSLVLCTYGVEYVEDLTTHKRVPTINRASYTSVFDDENYKSALEYADGYQREIYIEEAKALNEIQKGILAISQNEEPFDVFICYKESDANGRRTQDSVLANDLYHQLTQEGFKVFFARITLEDKLGSAYEPYIFSALNTSKVMVVLGTKPEYFNAVWVKNEWSRYLALIKGGAKKVLIPAYKGMDAYDLPSEFAHLQAQDMSKLGFMQDLIRGINKIAKADNNNISNATQSSVNANMDSLLTRAKQELEGGDYKKARKFCERVLESVPENYSAWWGLFLCDFQVASAKGLLSTITSGDKFYYATEINKNINYKRALKYAAGNSDATVNKFNKSLLELIDKELNSNVNRIQSINAKISERNVANQNNNDTCDQKKKILAEKKRAQSEILKPLNSLIAQNEKNKRQLEFFVDKKEKISINDSYLLWILADKAEFIPVLEQLTSLLMCIFFIPHFLLIGLWVYLIRKHSCQKKINKLESEISSLSQKINPLRKKLSVIEEEILSIKNKIKLHEEQERLLNKFIDELKKQISDLSHVNTCYEHFKKTFGKNNQ